MVELTEREKKIVMIKFIMHNDGPFSQLPMGTRENMLAASLKIMNMEYNKDEMLDIGQAVVDLQHNFVKSGQQFMQANAGAFQEALKHMNIDKNTKKLG